MRYSGRTERDNDEPWFRLGQIEVTSTIFVLVAWVATLLLWAAEPIAKPVTTGMALIPDQVAIGEVWRIATWPWSHAGFGLWDIIGAVLFYVFGTDLERQTGRRPFALLLGSSVLIIGLVATILSVLLSTETVLQDLDLLGLTVLILYIAEHPLRPFFFGIPAWVIGAVIVSLELINDLASREWIRLLSILIAGALITLIARKVHLLAAYDRIPDVKLPRRRARDDRTSGEPSSGPARRKPKPAASPKKRPGPLWGKGREPEQDAEIVQMPTTRRRAVPLPTNEPEVSVDDLALDALLDKIAEGGMEALTDAERQELSDLRARRRGDGPPS